MPLGYFLIGFLVLANIVAIAVFLDTAFSLSAIRKALERMVDREEMD